ncbi:MAG: hypothetical protein ACKPKO_05980 [Candidatus Fonsibacter sp.]
MTDHNGYAQLNKLTEMGAHPRRWIELLQIWKNRHAGLSLPRPQVAAGDPHPPLLLGSDFVALVIDGANGLQMKDNVYTGLEFGAPNGNTMYQEYRALMEEFS